jgi:hypothetical protein
MGVTGMPIGERTSNKAAGEANSAKRPRGRHVKVGHFHDAVRSTHFAKVVLSPELEMFPIPRGFCPYLGILPRTIILKTNTSFSWMVKPRDIKGIVCQDQGWPGFAIAHQVKIGYFMTFKVPRGDVFKVTIFKYTMTEVIQRCPQHHPTLAMIDD